MCWLEMCSKILLIVITILVTSVRNDKIEIRVFANVDSEPENVTITDGPIQYPKDIFHLLIANQTIPKLGTNSVVLRNDLSVLQLKNISVHEIEEGAFNITPSLALVRITQNPLNTIKRHIFNNLKVKQIDLSENQITAIETDAFDNNTYLQMVKLNNNLIKEINPDWFLNSPNVYKLSVVFNDIKSVPAEAFKNMAQDRPLKLRLSANRITVIDSKAFVNHGLIESLRINGNKIVSLPEDIFKNTTIRNLQVNTNNLQCFPDIIFQKNNIDSLTFTDNYSFDCKCLMKVKSFAEQHRDVDIWYPSIICEDKVREVNIVFNYNKTYELPLLPPFPDKTDDPKAVN